MAKTQVQAGGVRILFTEYCRGTKESLTGLRRAQDDCDAALTAILARRDEIDRRMDALLGYFGEATESMHRVAVSQPPQVSRVFRAFDGVEPTVAQLKATVAHQRLKERAAARAVNQSAAA